MAAKKVAKKEEPFNPGPPMAARLGMSDDWIVTAWDFVNGCWTHFYLRKKGKQYEIWEIEVHDKELDVSKVSFKEKPKKTDPTARVKDVDTAVEKIEDLLDDGEGEEDDDEEDDED